VAWRARVTLKGKLRVDVPLVHLTDPDQEPDAKLHAAFISEQAAKLRRAGKIETLAARSLLEALGAEPTLGPEAETIVDRLCGTKGDPLAARGGGVTFAQFAKRWTDGELAIDYPDHVKTKNATIDTGRLSALCKIDVGGLKLGAVALRKVSLDHAERAMAGLPDDVKRPATRRQYAQILHRVLALAVYPCRLIPINPLPKGFLPKIGKAPAFPYVYPDEDTALLSNAEVPLWRRVLFGFLAREGCRISEASALTFADLDLKRGTVSLDANKTDDPRAWALDPGVMRALVAWKALRDAELDDHVFIGAEGARLAPDSLAPELRADLLASGVTRRELFEAGENRRVLRVHDLRATFITLSLANGRSETWVADRTGHTSSIMINRYRRQARAAAELKLGKLKPMDLTISELRGPSPISSPTRAKKKKLEK
jgi:integrase